MPDLKSLPSQEMGDEIQIISPSDFYLLDTLGSLGMPCLGGWLAQAAFLLGSVVESVEHSKVKGFYSW